MKKIVRALDFIIPTVAVIAIILASLYIYQSKKSYSEAENEYTQLEELAGVTDVPEEIVEDTADTVAEEDIKFLNLNIDFDALKKENPDTVGWIYIPVLDINYPVVQTTDNNYYLKHTFSGKNNGSGAIFLDAEMNPDMSGYNTFIYGHNMKNGTMFGSLKTLAGDEVRLKGLYIYYYTDNHAFKYKTFANYIAKTNSFTYYLSEDSEQLSNYIEKVQSVNKFEYGKSIDVSGVDKIITLSTCSGVNTGNRTIVQAYLEKDYEY